MDGPPQSQSQPQPAQPASAVATSILASELLNNLLHQRQLRHQCYCERQQGLGGGRLSEIGSDKESAYLRTECKEIDEYVLQGGVQRGSVVGLSAVDEIVGRVLSLNLLTTVLLSSPTASASIIDTTGTFPVSLLADILSYRLASETTQHRAKNRGKIQEEGEKAPTLDSKVGELLARVAISRVFDIEGVWEVVGEVARGCELAYARRTEAVGEEVEVEHLDVNEGEDVRNDQENSDERQVEVQPAAEPIMEIGDSEEEEEENVVNVDVDLDAREISLSTAPIAQQERTSDVSGETDAGADREINVGLGGGEVGTEVVILDNMTAVVSELFSRMEKQAAHTLISSLSRSLRSLSRTHNLATILLNSTTSTSTTANKPNHTSIFTSTSARPALGQIFTSLLDLSLLITLVPKTPQDAAALYGTTNNSSDIDDQMPSTARYVAHDETQDHVTYVYVLEVLLDECSPVLPLPNPNAGLNPVPPALNREQRWTPLALFRNAAGTAVAFCNAFEASNVQAGTMRGMNLSLDASKGVANVAKLYGFGRRV